MKPKKKMRRATAALLASFMAACILIPVLVGVAFGFYAYDIHPHLAALTMVLIALVAAKLLAPRINEFVSMYD